MAGVGVGVGINKRKPAVITNGAGSPANFILTAYAAGAL